MVANYINEVKIKKKTMLPSIVSGMFQAIERPDIIFSQLNPDILLSLALGHECNIFNCHEGSSFDMVYEFVKYVLEKRWFGHEYTPDISGLASKVVQQKFRDSFEKLSFQHISHIDTYKKYVHQNNSIIINCSTESLTMAFSA